MTTHLSGTRKEWLAARLELLEAEKELTRRSDEIARRRQAPRPRDGCESGAGGCLENCDVVRSRRGGSRG